MINSWVFNLYIALFGFFLVVFVSIQANTLETSLIRGLFSFVAFFLLTYGLRWVIKFVFTDTSTNNFNDSSITEEVPKENQSTSDMNNDNSNYSEKDNAKSTSSSSPIDDLLSNSNEGDIYKKTSDYVRELLEEDD